MNITSVIKSSSILLSTLLLWSPAGLAAGMVLVGEPTGLSLFIPGTAAVGGVGGSSPTIYGGIVAPGAGTMTGDCASASLSPDSTCNSCDGSGLKPCNPTSIHKRLVLKVTIQSDTAATFQQNPILRYKIGDSSYKTPASPLPALVVNTPMIVNIPWTDLCAASTSDAECRTNINGETLTVGISNDGDEDFEESVPLVVNLYYVDSIGGGADAYQQCDRGTTPASTTQGICDFEVFPGDEKLYLIDFAPSSNGLETPHGSVRYNRLVFFHGPTLTQITNTSPSIVLNLTNNSPAEPSLDSQKIPDLKNEQTYCLVLGNQDQTGNIAFFTPASERDQTNPVKVAKYCATPSQVVGLLDDKKCFIATATFGSDMAPEVVTFRKFRNEFLLTNFAGRAFVHNYYEYGPIAAEWISDSPFLKAVSVTLLWPLLLFVKLSLGVGFMTALLIVLIAAVTLQRAYLQLRRRRSSLGEA